MTKRFDESVFPTLDEVREWCLRDPEAIAGECMYPSRCVVANVLRERLPEDVAYIEVTPILHRYEGAVDLQLRDDEAFMGHIYESHGLPAELNQLAAAFDRLGGAGVPIKRREVVPICDRIIAERKVAA